MNYDSLKSLSDHHGNSFYLFYPERFLKNLNDISSSFRRYYSNSQVAYAFKANYMPVLAKYLEEYGYWGEVVSGMEYDIARMYLPGDQLVFNGPCKSYAEIKRALKERAVVNIDSFYEINLLKSMLDHFEEINIGLRVNFDIGIGSSRFGISYENGDLEEAIKKLNDMTKVRIIGIHSHFTTKDRSLPIFEKRVKGMLNIYSELPQKENIKYINIGGGFFGPMTEDMKIHLDVISPSFDEYAELIAGEVYDYFGSNGPVLIIEPGVSMVADSMDYVVRALDSKKIHNEQYLTVDGSINNLFSSGAKYIPSYEVISKEKCDVKKVNIVGYTCMEHDILLQNIDTSAKPGDFIVFHNRGAYSNVFTPPFIKPAPAVIGSNSEVYLRPQTFNDVISQNWL